MRLTTILGLTATAVLAVMAFVGASSAAAEYSTSLCLADTANSLCEKGPPEGEPPVVHLEDKTAVLKTTTPALTITCEALLEGENLGLAEAPNPLKVHVSMEGLKYANCNKGCAAKNELAGIILVLKTGPEVATVTGDGFKVHLTCGVVVDCKYNANGLVLHGLGALLAGPNGVASSVEATISKEGGGVCPATAKLTVEYVPLVPLYIRS